MVVSLMPNNHYRGHHPKARCLHKISSSRNINGYSIHHLHYFVPGIVTLLCHLILVCGGIITDTNGVIRAETKTAGGYHNNEKCTWLIRFPAGQRVSIQFSKFRLEYQPSCRFDYVEIRDGDGASSPLVGRFCGSIVPPPFISTGNTLSVTFVTDYSVNYDGFTMRYSNAGPGGSSFYCYSAFYCCTTSSKYIQLCVSCILTFCINIYYHYK